MLPRLAVRTLALGWLLVMSPPVHAQVFPLPVGPSLPLPPFPISDFRIEPPPTPKVSSTPPIEPRSSAGLDERRRAPSNAESEALLREALLQSRAHESWYGWQTITVDAAAVGILLLGAALVTLRPEPPTSGAGPGPLPVAVAAASVGLYAVGPPAIHFAHGGLWRGFASIGLRVVMPLAGFAFGYFAGGAPGGGRAFENGAWRSPWRSWSDRGRRRHARVGSLVRGRCADGAFGRANLILSGGTRRRPPTRLETMTAHEGTPT
jgi:hypothetical protein